MFCLKERNLLIQVGLLEWHLNHDNGHLRDWINLLKDQPLFTAINDTSCNNRVLQSFRRELGLV